MCTSIGALLNTRSFRFRLAGSDQEDPEALANERVRGLLAEHAYTLINQLLSMPHNMELYVSLQEHWTGAARCLERNRG